MTAAEEAAVAQASEAATEQHRDRLLFGAVLVVGAGIAIVLLLTGAILIVSRQTSGDVRSGVAVLNGQAEGQAITSCRAAFKAELVDAPTARALKALARYGYETPQFVAATDDIREDEYEGLTTMAKRDPAKFLARCGSDSATRFSSCDSAQAAGATPLRRGDPGYSSALDADGDGVACE